MLSSKVFAALLSAVCYVESGHNPKAINWDDGGSPSYGECQIKYATAKQMGYRGSVTALWLDRRLNRKYASLYLQYQINRYQDVRKGIAAYNAGTLPNGEIRNTKYVRKVMRALQEGR